MVRRSLAAFLLFIACMGAKADVVTPGHIRKQVMFTNLDKFPGFKFTIKHYGYHYDKGWQPYPADTVSVENNMRYFISEKGGEKELLMARDAKNRLFVSATKVGGNAVVAPNISGLVEVYSIVSIKNKKITIKKIKDILLYPDGEEKEKKSGLGIAGWVGGDGFSSALAIATIAALLGLVALFVMRKRKPKYIQLAS